MLEFSFSIGNNHGDFICKKPDEWPVKFGFDQCGK